MKTAALKSVLDRNILAIVGEFVASRYLKFCCAKLVNVLQRWTLNKLEKKEPTTLTLSIRELWEELLGEHGKDAIQRSIESLVEVGLLDRWQEPHSPVRAYRYRFNLDLWRKLESGNRQEKTAKPAPTEDPPIISDQSPIISDCSPTTQDPPLDPTQKAGFFSEEEEIGQGELPEVVPQSANQEEKFASQAQNLAGDRSSAVPDSQQAKIIENAPAWWRKQFAQHAGSDAPKSALSVDLRTKRRWLSDPVLREEAIRWAQALGDRIRLIIDNTGQVTDFAEVG